jgi:hypothetical protein
MIANVMLASASVFESLSDVDSKFSKTLDKEYDAISDEVKKSFKKLTVRWYIISLVLNIHVPSPERREDAR